MASRAPASVTLSAGNVSAPAGTTVSVPIILAAGSTQISLFAFTLTVVAQSGAPAIAGKLTYQANTPPGAPSLASNSTVGAYAAGYFDVSPPLTGTQVIGNLNIPLPKDAAGSYQVQVSHLSAGEPDFSPVVIMGVDGTITIVIPPVPSCVGDCSGDAVVTETELIAMIDIALDRSQITSCPAGHRGDDDAITVDEIVMAVRNAADGCVVSR